MFDLDMSAPTFRICLVTGCSSKEETGTGFCAYHLKPSADLARMLGDRDLEMDGSVVNGTPEAISGPEISDGIVSAELDCDDTNPDGIATAIASKPRDLMTADQAAKSNGKSNRDYNNCEGMETIADVVAVVPELAATVAKEPVYTAMGEPVPKSYATIRTYPDGTRQLLGMVGEKYQVVQDSRAFEIVGALLDKKLIHKVNGGSYQGRTWLYGEAAHASVAKGDDVGLRILFGNSHDGSLKLGIGQSAIRVVCQNTMLHAMHNSKGLLKLRHTAGISELIDQFQEAMEIGGVEFLQSVDKMRQMRATKISDDQLKEYTGYVFSQWADTEEEEQETERAGQRVYVKIAENYENGIGAVPGTAWGAYNAVTQYLTHERGRGTDAARFADSHWGEGAKLGRRAWDGAVSMAR